MCRKVKLLLLSLIFLVPFMVFAEDKVESTNHSGDVYIASSELIKASDGVEEIEKPTLKDLNVKFNVRFSEVNQSIEYKLIIKNISSKDYNISTDNSFNKSDYITYNFKYDDGSDIIKANSEEEMLVTITYSKEVPSDKLTDGKFIEDNAMSLNLSDKMTNPSTILQGYGVNILLVIITCVVVFYFLKTKNIKNSLKILVLGFILIPIAVKAIDTIKVTIDSHVEIETEGEFCYRAGMCIDNLELMDSIATKLKTNKDKSVSTTKLLCLGTTIKLYFKYKRNMTWEEYLNSDYNKITDTTTITYDNKQLNVKDYREKLKEKYSKNYNDTSKNWNPIYLFGNDFNDSFNYTPNTLYSSDTYDEESGPNQELDSKIIDLSHGCYYYDSRYKY